MGRVQLRDTRKTVKWRLVVVILLLGAICVYSSYEVVVASSGRMATQIYTIDHATLQGMVNQSGIQFVQSQDSVPYYVVESGNSTGALGLIYLTTDIAPASSYGYSGPIGVLVFVNTTGYIQSIRMWHITDSFAVLVTQSWLNGFVGRSVFETMTVGKDVTPISGATFSSTGITGGVRDAGRAAVNAYNNVSTGGGGGVVSAIVAFFRDMGLVDFIKIFGLVALYAGAVVAFVRDDERIKYAVFAGSIVLIGVYASRMISISDMPTFLSLNLPPLSSSLYWYLLYGGAILTSVVWGRIYCGYLCPFGAVTEIMYKLSPVKRVFPKRLHDRLDKFKYFNAVIVLIGFGLGVSFLDYEPFATLFLLKGDAIAWIVLGAVLVLSLFYNRFYCSYICPVSAGLAVLGRLRVREMNRWPECKTCRVCERQCCMEAISGPSISAIECFNCRGCEEYYSDFAKCPHYALERAAKVRGENNGPTPLPMVEKKGRNR